MLQPCPYYKITKNVWLIPPSAMREGSQESLSATRLRQICCPRSAVHLAFPNRNGSQTPRLTMKYFSFGQGRYAPCGLFSASCKFTVSHCNSMKISGLSGLVLDISTAGVTIEYHLRSVSGSSGPEAKESSPLFGIGPILFVSLSIRGGWIFLPVECRIADITTDSCDPKYCLFWD